MHGELELHSPRRPLRDGKDMMSSSVAGEAPICAGQCVSSPGAALLLPMLRSRTTIDNGTATIRTERISTCGRPVAREKELKGSHATVAEVPAYYLVFWPHHTRKVFGRCGHERWNFESFTIIDDSARKHLSLPPGGAQHITIL